MSLNIINNGIMLMRIYKLKEKKKWIAVNKDKLRKNVVKEMKNALVDLNANA